MVGGEGLRNARFGKAAFWLCMAFCVAAVGCATDGGARGGTSVGRRSPPRVGGLECSAAAVDKAQTKGELLSLREHCSGSDAEGWAWQKLNRLPPPGAPNVALQPRPTTESSDRVTLEAEVYFDVCEVSLPEQGLQRLNKLIEAVGRS